MSTIRFHPVLTSLASSSKVIFVNWYLNLRQLMPMNCNRENIYINLTEYIFITKFPFFFLLTWQTNLMISWKKQWKGLLVSNLLPWRAQQRCLWGSSASIKLDYIHCIELKNYFNIILFIWCQCIWAFMFLKCILRWYWNYTF